MTSWHNAPPASRLLLPVALALLLPFLSFGIAQAITLATPQGSVCPNYTTVPYAFGAGPANHTITASALNYDTQHDFVHSGSYSNNTDLVRTISNNGWIKDIQFHLTNFSVYPDADQLAWGTGPYSACSTPFTYPNTSINPASATPFVIQGSFAPGSLPLWMDGCNQRITLQNPFPFLGWPASNVVTPYPLVFHWTTNSSNNDSGFAIDQLKFCSDNAQAFPFSTTLMRPGYANQNSHAQGIFLGQNDTIYYSFAGPTANNIDSTIVVWPQAPTTNDDYAILVKCNALPTVAANDYLIADPGPDQYLHLTAPYCVNGTVWVAVNDATSRVGANVFNIAIQSHPTSDHLRTLRAGISFNAIPSQLADIKAMLREGVRAWFSATLGGKVVEEIELSNRGGAWNDCDCHGHGCNICVMMDNANPPCVPNDGRIDCRSYYHSDVFYQRVRMRPDTWDTSYYISPIKSFIEHKALTHELSHWKFGYDDEYVESCSLGTGCTTCGHSIMATPFHEDLNTLCSPIAHGKDGNDPEKSEGGNSQWGVNFVGTPDNLNYVFFNFNETIHVSNQRMGALIDD